MSEQTWFQIEYEAWQSFRFQGKRFLALFTPRKVRVHIYGKDLENYGAYFDVDSFRKMYASAGEALCLAKAKGE